MSRLLLLAASLGFVACGRTQPLSADVLQAGKSPSAPESQVPGPLPSTPGESGAAPLLVDFDLGLLTAHALDGQVAFSRQVTTSSRGRQFERLTGGAGVVARTHLTSGVQSRVLGLVRADGVTVFESDPSTLDVVDAWLSSGGVVGRATSGGFVVDHGMARRFAARPLGGMLTSGLVATLDDDRTIEWVDPTVGATLRHTTVSGTAAAQLVDASLYATTTATVAESTPGADVTLPAPFSFPQLIAANRARQVLVSDPNLPHLWMFDFAASTTARVSLEDPLLAAVGTFVDRALDLDDRGGIYATFVSSTALTLMRTTDLGAHWIPVGAIPLTQELDVVRAARRGTGVLVAGGHARGPTLTDWSFAAWFDDSGSATVLPVTGVSTLNGELPVTLSSHGARAAFWSPTASGATLCAFNTVTGVTDVLEQRAFSLGTGFSIYPSLAWLE